MIVSLGVIKLIVAVILILQVILAIFNYRNVVKATLRKDFLLTSYVSPVDMLESFSRVYHPLQIKVNADIQLPAELKGDLLLVNRKWVYQHRALPSIWILRLLSKQAQPLSSKKWMFIQGLLFVLSGLLLFSEFAILGLVLEVVNIAISITVELKIARINNMTLMLANDLLDLSESERENTKKMLLEWEGGGWTYPVEIFLGLLRFILPF